jgi:hypothetical protein
MSSKYIISEDTSPVGKMKKGGFCSAKVWAPKYGKRVQWRAPWWVYQVMFFARAWTSLILPDYNSNVTCANAFAAHAFVIHPGETYAKATWLNLLWSHKVSMVWFLQSRLLSLQYTPWDQTSIGLRIATIRSIRSWYSKNEKWSIQQEKRLESSWNLR